MWGGGGREAGPAHGLTINRPPSPFNLLVCLIRARRRQEINKSITEGFCIQESGKEIQSKQINVPARMRNPGPCN